MGAVWSVLVVGGGLAGAIFVWLLRDQRKGDAVMEKDPLPGEAPGGGDQRCGGGPRSSGPSKRELDIRADHLQGGSEHFGSEPQESGKIQGGASQLQSPCGEECENSRECVSSGWFPDTDSLPHEVGYSWSFLDSSRNGKLNSSGAERGFYKGQDTSTKVAPCFVEKLPNLLADKAETVSLERLASQELASTEDWEVVSRHSSWGEIGLGGSLEAFVSSSTEGMDYDRDILVEAKDLALSVQIEREVVSSESQQVRVQFQTHYIPSTDTQAIAVTGDHESLGKWNTYIPLQYSQEGLWSHSMLLPADTGMEWKFVVVENGRIIRWEECKNRFLETGFEDKVLHKWWGFH